MTGPVAEKDFQAKIVQLAKLYRWRVFHAFDSRRSEPGFLDLTLLRPPELLFVELKTDEGRLRPEQLQWIAGLRQVADALMFGMAVACQQDARHAAGDVQLPDSVLVDPIACIEVHVWRPAVFDVAHERLKPRPHNRPSTEAIAA